MRRFKDKFKNLSGSLKTRIMFWFVAISLIPLAIFLIFSISLIKINADKEIKSKLDAAKNISMQEIERLYKLSLDYSILISSNPELREAVLKKDHLKVVQIISPLASELKISQIIVTDERGILIGRSDILSRYGDNMKDSYLVKCGLARLKYTSIENENGMIYIKSVSDIVTRMSANNMKVIGTVTVGYKLDKNFVENLVHLTKMDIILYLEKQSKNNIFSKDAVRNVVDKDLLQQAFSGELEYVVGTTTKEDYHYVLLPIRKDQKMQVVGVLAVISKNSLVSGFIKTSFKFSMILFLATLVLVGVISLFISNRITKPIAQLVEGAKKVALGRFDIQLSYNENAKDEISLLTREFSRMVKNVHAFASNIDRTLKTTQQYIDRLNSIANDSAKTSQITNEQIKEIIQLAEKQKIKFEKTAILVSELESQIQKMFDTFKIVEKEISAIYTTTSREQESIRKLINHMYTANSAINEVAKELDKAIKDFKAIARTSLSISNLAERIKIIALNASIEAAKRNIPTFEIIASEISKLSQSANTLAKTVTESIEKNLSTFDITNTKLINILEVVKDGVEVAKKSSESLWKIEMTNTQIKDKIAKVTEEVSAQQEKIFTINNVLKTQTQTISQYFLTLMSIRDIFQSQKKAVDKLIDQFSDVYEGIVKLTSISMNAEKN